MSFQVGVFHLDNPLSRSLGASELIIERKEDAGRLLAKVRTEIPAVCRNINKIDGIIFLLCMEDAFENLLLKSHSALIRNLNRFVDAGLSSMILQRHIKTYLSFFDSALQNIIQYGGSSVRKVSELPTIEVGIGFSDRPIFETLSREIEKGHIKPRSALYVRKVYFLGVLPGYVIISFRELSDEVAWNHIVKLLELRELLLLNGILTTYLKVGGKLSIRLIDPTNYQIMLPEHLKIDDILREELSTPRMLESQNEVYRWGSEFDNVAIENIKRADLGRGFLNRLWLERESQEIINAYLQFPKFEETFQKLKGYSISQLAEVLLTLERISLSKKHTIVMSSHRRLAVRIAKHTTLTRKRVEGLLKELSRDEMSRLLYINGQILTNWRRVVTTFLTLLNECFVEAYDNNPKGAIFEERCRALLRENDFIVYPHRVVIKEPMLPAEISINIWGKIKKKTDLDVLAIKDHFLLLLECKERCIKSRIGLGEQNLFDRYRIELWYKAQWIQRNPEKMKKYVSGPFDFFSHPPNKIYMLPMLVCNFPVISDDDPLPLLTYNELKEVSKSLPYLTERLHESENEVFHVFVDFLREVSKLTVFRF